MMENTYLQLCNSESLYKSTTDVARTVDENNINKNVVTFISLLIDDEINGQAEPSNKCKSKAIM